MNGVIIPISRFESLDSIIDKINESIKGVTVKDIYLKRTSMLKGEISIVISPPQIREVEKVVEKEVIKEVPLKIINQVKKTTWRYIAISRRC